MDIKMVDVTLHIDETTSLAKRESLRDVLLAQNGVMSADNHLEAPHLFVVAYDPDKIQSHAFVDIAEKQGLHAELIGL